MAISGFCLCLLVPGETSMGAIQRLMYFHVPLAILSYLFLFLLFVSSLFSLRTPSHVRGGDVQWESLASASASLAFLMCSLVLVTGVIWGRVVWNVWWNWEPRLLSVALLWFMLLTYLLLREHFPEGQKRRIVSSIFGILLAFNVPIVIFSVYLYGLEEQLHPREVVVDGLGVWRFFACRISCFAASFFLSLWLFSARYTNLVLRTRLLSLARELV